MKPIPTFVHGVFDYVAGLALLAAPELFGFSGTSSAAEAVPRVLGVIVLLQAVSTDYELGVFRLISMRTHIVNDYIAGAFLALSPWLFGFNTGPRNMWMPHLIVGIVVIVLTALTDPVPRERLSTQAS